MSEVRLWIDEQEITCHEGEYLLQVARARGIFIPAICYLSRCSPTLACKLCMVEADGKRVYACNAKAKEGMKIYTNTPEILEERRAILQVYAVNHPLECGVCDKSGECELQNYTLLMQTHKQDYSIRDSHKPKESWGQVFYDPSLCITCERCVTLCKDMIGDSTLKSIKSEGDTPPKELKDSMPKDAYGVWNKFSKSLIGRAKEELCVDCGECVSVCPVGALTHAHFHYTSNAWELEKIWSSCVHCSMGCLLGYEVKQGRIYRISNDWNFGNLCGAGRFGFDVWTHSFKDKAQFHSALEAFMRADTIAFSSYITNEEALILQKLKESRGYKLYNPEAWAFKRFLNAFGEASGELYNATKEDISASDFMITLGTAVRYDAPALKYAINNTLKMRKGSQLLYLHPLEDTAMLELSKNVQSVRYAPMSEERVLALLLQLFARGIEGELAEFLRKNERRVRTAIPVQESSEKDETSGESQPQNAQDYEERYESALSEELGIGDIHALRESILSSASPILIIGADLYAHKQALNIARMLGILQKHSNLKILLTPPSTNTLGVSLICDLDEEKGNYTIGYNTQGDYILSSLPKKANLLMPALNQQEGTLLNIDKRVIPIHPALPYEGYELNDLAKALGFTLENTIDYTPLLPQEQGFLGIEFDSLPNHYENDGTQRRGYGLGNVSKEPSALAQIPAPLSACEFNAYARNPASQFSIFTAQSSLLESKAGIYVSPSFLHKLNVPSGTLFELSPKGLSDCAPITLPIFPDSSMEGEWLAVSTYPYFGDSHPLFAQGYRFANLTLKRVNT